MEGGVQAVILVSDYLWKLPVSGDRWAGQQQRAVTVQPEQQHTEPFQPQAQSAGKTRPSRTTRPQGMLLLLFIHSVLQPSSLHFVSLAGKGSPCSCQSVLPCHSSVADGFLCADVTSQRLCCEHSYQINLPEIHLTPSCEHKVALPKHHTYNGANRQQTANFVCTSTRFAKKFHCPRV